MSDPNSPWPPSPLNAPYELRVLNMNMSGRGMVKRRAWLGPAPAQPGPQSVGEDRRCEASLHQSAGLPEAFVTADAPEQAHIPFDFVVRAGVMAKRLEGRRSG